MTRSRTTAVPVLSNRKATGKALKQPLRKEVDSFVGNMSATISSKKPAPCILAMQQTGLYGPVPDGQGGR